MTDDTPVPASRVAPTPALKLNIGCGFHKHPEFINVDSFPDCNPDVLWDLERTPWPFEDDSVDEIVARHILEHLGQAPQTFFAIIKEIYRVVRHNGAVRVAVPHPLHTSFFSDPTHVRSFTKETFLMLSRRHNLNWRDQGKNVTLLALMLDVNFDPIDIHHLYDKPWRDKVARGEMTEDQLREAETSQFGVIRDVIALLRVDKSHRQQSS
jgi:SAM-dependent methyltransferase